MFKKLLAITLVGLSLFGLTGCQSIAQIEEVIAYTHDSVQEIQKQITELKQDQETRVAELEAKLGHPLDANQDGKFDMKEASGTVKDLAAKGDPSIFDLSTYLTLIMALLTMGGSKTAGNAIMDKLKKHVSQSAAK